MENRRIVVVNANFTPEQKQKIVKTAEKYGAFVDFYRKNSDAMPNLAGAEVVYGMGADLAANSTDAKWFCSASAGIDAYVESGVFADGSKVLTNSSGSYGVTISEHIIMISLMLMRRIPEYEKLIANHQWVNNLPVKSLNNSHIVVLGTGDIGSTFAKRVRSFEPASLIGVSRSGRQVEPFDSVVDISQLGDVISDVDLLVLCLPGTSETQGILSREVLSKLPSTAYIVNVGRGSAIDEDALVDALNNHQIAGAGLDVFNEEPLPDSSPLWTAENIIITSHISGQESLGWTVENNVNMFCTDLENYFEGRPLAQAVDLFLGY